MVDNYTSAPLNTIKSIVASTWPEFIAEIKRTVKEGKQQPHRLLYQDSFFKCLLVDGKNAGFAEALDQITGEEAEVLKCLDMLLESANVKTVPVEQNTLTQTPEMYAKTEVEKSDSGVDVSLVKSKPSSRKRSKKDV